ncbi:MAG TPA: hypothetical protein VLW48_02705 [Candidatus Bathyarchaeia archaeon]|nr:hypothetical protein [Candidatus Bathyarchaeia archaeon]
MSSFTNADAIQLWTIGLCVALMLVGLSLGAIVAYIWKYRPEKVDPVRQTRMEIRLSQLAETATFQPEKSI